MNAPIAYQAILTRVIPATNTKPTRIKASCARGSKTISDPRSVSSKTETEAHRHAATVLVRGFVAEDLKQYGSKEETNPWAKPFVTGCLPNGDFAHVFATA